MKLINSQIAGEELSVSPRRAESRKRAAEKMQKSALAMIKTARKSYGNDKPFDVETVVHVPPYCTRPVPVSSSVENVSTCIVLTGCVQRGGSKHNILVSYLLFV